MHLFETPSPTRLLLLRHGEVEDRFHRVFGGRIDMDLSPRGHQQAAVGLGVRAQMMLNNPALRRQFVDHIIDTRDMSKAALDAGLDKSPEFQLRLEEARVELLSNLYQKQYLAENSTDEPTFVRRRA